MKSNNITKVFFICILFFCGMLANVAQAQEQGYRWGKWIAGQTTSSGALGDEIVDSYIDSLGNTYMLGNFRTDARLGEDAPYICPMDGGVPGYRIGNSQGVFLAKIDSIGEVLWCKYAKGGNSNSGANAWNMVVKDGRITIALDATFSGAPYDWFYLFDTMVVEPSSTQTVTIKKLFFVTFDENGNRTDRHNIQLFAYYSPTSPGLNTRLLGAGFCSKFCIDQDDNIHIFAEGLSGFDNSSHG